MNLENESISSVGFNICVVISLGNKNLKIYNNL